MSLKRVVLFGVMYLILASDGGTYGIENENPFSSVEEEEMELERQVKIMNKPPIKTIRTDYGDIIDCIDILKQPAFDHPLLKNHKIQMSPTDLHSHQTLKNEGDSVLVSNSGLLIPHGCPSGTVPIRRTTKEDLKRSKSFTNSFARIKAAGNGHHFATVEMHEYWKPHFRGAVALICASNPRCTGRQSSSAQIWLEGGPVDHLNTVQAGWIVSRNLYGDTRTRIFGYWTGDNFRNGCYNLLCPGFVQISKDYSFGHALENISVYHGVQFVLPISILQDVNTKHWWLSLGQDYKKIGYWPKELFPHFADGSDRLTFGGHTHSTPPEPSPEMGNGQFPAGYYDRSSYFLGLQYKGQGGAIKAPTDNITTEYVDNKRCYNVDYLGYGGRSTGHAFLFGGPGGDC